jgi:WD40 repeat protein
LTDPKSAVVLQGHPDEPQTIAFSPDGKLLASGDKSGTVIVWNVEERSEVARLSLGR